MKVSDKAKDNLRKDNHEFSHLGQTLGRTTGNVGLRELSGVICCVSWVTDSFTQRWTAISIKVIKAHLVVEG